MAPTAPSSAGMLLVRIHPLGRGHVRKTFIVHGLGQAFEVDKGWYEVDARVARQLVKFLNNDNDPTSPPVFQVVTREAALKIDARGISEPAKAKSPIRMALNASQHRASIPKPITLPAAGEAPATEAEPESVETADDTEAYDEAFGEETAAEEAPANDLTTADIRGTATRPRKMVPDEDDEVAVAPPKPIEVPADIAEKVAKAAAKSKAATPRRK